MTQTMKARYRNHRTTWTHGELTFVENHYGRIPTVEMAKTLGRTAAAIRLIAQELGCTRAPSVPWSDAEKAVILTCYANGAGIASLQGQLPGRTGSTIAMMAKKLGVKSGRHWHPDEVRVLHEFYPAMGTRVADKLPRRSREAVKIKASQLGVKYHKLPPRGAPTKRWRDEEWRLLKQHLTLPYDELSPLFPGRSKASLEKAKARLRARAQATAE